MHLAVSSLCTDGTDALDRLITSVDKAAFHGILGRLHRLFDIYASTCPVPLPAPGLIITQEIRSQCERYLPMSAVSTLFNRLYRTALTYRPILSSTPFHAAMSWADAFASLPEQFQTSADPARLMESLLDDRSRLTSFLFASFLPGRFYGGIGRYPAQQGFIRKWLTARDVKAIRCLDAACGIGEDTYALALLLAEAGQLPESLRLEGWTLEPLEVWAAAYRRLPHDPNRERQLREATRPLSSRGFDRSIRFSCRDILAVNNSTVSRFDLILCNGLLGGPIIHEREQLNRAVENLAQLLTPGGILLAADNFHGGWQQKCPQHELRALFERNDLKTFEAGEGIGGLKPDQ